MNTFYSNGNRIINSNELYRRYFSNKNIQTVTHYGTSDFSGLNDKFINNLDVNYYSWRLGDTWENVAREHGVDVKNWKVLALINNKPISSLCHPGDTIIIPINIEEVLKRL